MASLRRVPGCHNWIACFTDKDGVRRQRSTGSRDRKVAQKIADSYEDASRKNRTARQTRTVIAEMHRTITGENLRAVTFREFAESWLNTKRPETAPATAKFYENAISKFSASLGPKADTEIVDVTKGDILAFRNTEAKSFAPKTVNHDLKVVRMIFRAARSEGLLAEDPAEFIKTVKASDVASRRPFTLPELRAILSVADDEGRAWSYLGFIQASGLGTSQGLRGQTST